MAARQRDLVTWCGGLRWVTRTVDRDWILWMRSGRRGQAAAMAVLPDSLSDGKQTLLSKLTAACPEMTSLAALVCSFAGLLTPAPANEAALKDWAEAARACDLPNMHAFTRGLDLASTPRSLPSPCRFITAGPRA